MAYSGTGLINRSFIESPAGIFKIAELLFGSTAWYPYMDKPLSGPFLFYYWVTAGSWGLTLFTYAVHLFQRTKIPSNDDEKRAANAPNLADIFMNVFITFIYCIAIIIFGYFNFSAVHISSGPSQNSVAIFTMIMAGLTCIVHLNHAATIFVFATLGRERWKRERRWFWESEVQLANPQQNPAYDEEALGARQ